MKKRNLTKGNVTAVMLLFAVPMILGNIMQQCYNLADTWIVGRFVGAEALAAVGSAYTLMTFLNSILIGMCMGSGALFLHRIKPIESTIVSNPYSCVQTYSQIHLSASFQFVQKKMHAQYIQVQLVLTLQNQAKTTIQ